MPGVGDAVEDVCSHVVTPLDGEIYVYVAIAQGCGVEASGAVLVLNFLAREFLRSFER